jgi:hypothetical protein
MKKFAPIFIILATLAGCDSPRSQRAISSSSNGIVNNGGMNFTNNSNSNNNSNTNTTTTTTTNSPVIPSDATHCKFASDGVTGFETESSHLGSYTLCQSSSDKNSFYFQLKTPPTNGSGDVSICFIPTTSNGTNSIYVGNPMCGYFKDPKSVRKIAFVKYANYSNATINGVIFFKDVSWYYPVFNNYVMTLDAYKYCMNMVAYGNTAYCQAFKQVGQYIYRQF